MQSEAIAKGSDEWPRDKAWRSTLLAWKLRVLEKHEAVVKVPYQVLINPLNSRDHS
jgi:hypothetical protein